VPARPATKGGDAGATHRITITTAYGRGAELADFRGGVMLALFDDCGNCAVNHITANFGAGSGGGEKLLEFDRDTRESIEIASPQLQGKVDKVWIGPGTGTWFPESVDVQSLDSDTVFTFKNKKALGYRQDESAAELFLFDPELERAKNVKAAEADARKYKQLKTSLVALDVVLVVAGASALFFWKEPADAVTFGAGGLVGFAYLLLLEKQVESLGADEDSRSWLEKVLTFPAFRFLVVFASMYLITFLANNANTQQDRQVSLIIVEAVAGLLMYKVAALVVGVISKTDSSLDKGV